MCSIKQKKETNQNYVPCVKNKFSCIDKTFIGETKMVYNIYVTCMKE